MRKYVFKCKLLQKPNWILQQVSLLFARLFWAIQLSLRRTLVLWEVNSSIASYSKFIHN